MTTKEKKKLQTRMEVMEKRIMEAVQGLSKKIGKKQKRNKKKNMTTMKELMMSEVAVKKRIGRYEERTAKLCDKNN